MMIIDLQIDNIYLSQSYIENTASKNKKSTLNSFRLIFQ